MQLHPALVHFPIALFFAAGAFYAAATFGQKPWLKEAAWYLHLAGITGNLLAIFSGLNAQDGLHLSEEVEGYLQNHTLLGYLVIWIFGLLAVWQYLRQGKGHRSEQLAFLAVFVVGLAVMVYSAWLGGHMVYSHGVGVEPQ